MNAERFLEERNSLIREFSKVKHELNLANIIIKKFRKLSNNIQTNSPQNFIERLVWFGFDECYFSFGYSPEIVFLAYAKDGKMEVTFKETICDQFQNIQDQVIRYILNIESEELQTFQKYLVDFYLPRYVRNPRMDELLAKINGSSRFNAENSAKAFIEAVEKSKRKDEQND